MASSDEVVGEQMGANSVILDQCAALKSFLRDARNLIAAHSFQLSETPQTRVAGSFGHMDPLSDLDPAAQANSDEKFKMKQAERSA